MGRYRHESVGPQGDNARVRSSRSSGTCPSLARCLDARRCFERQGSCPIERLETLAATPKAGAWATTPAMGATATVSQQSGFSLAINPRPGRRGTPRRRPSRSALQHLTSAQQSFVHPSDRGPVAEELPPSTGWPELKSARALITAHDELPQVPGRGRVPHDNVVDDARRYVGVARRALRVSSRVGISSMSTCASP